MYSWNCYVLLSSGSWYFYHMTAQVWQSQDWTVISFLRNTKNNLYLTHSRCALLLESAHVQLCAGERCWNSAASSDSNCRWDQIEVRSASFFCIPNGLRILGGIKNPPGKKMKIKGSTAEHSGLALASFPEEPCPAVSPAGLRAGCAQRLSHRPSDLKHVWQRGRGKSPCEFRENRHGKGRGNKSVLLLWPSARHELPPHQTPENPQERDPRYNPPNQHKMSNAPRTRALAFVWIGTPTM